MDATQSDHLGRSGLIYHVKEMVWQLAHKQKYWTWWGEAKTRKGEKRDTNASGYYSLILIA